jgi:hypothetical protein
MLNTNISFASLYGSIFELSTAFSRHNISTLEITNNQMGGGGAKNWSRRELLKCSVSFEK